MREKAGLSQKQVAEILKKSVPAVRSWDQGKRNPRKTQYENMGERYLALCEARIAGKL